MKLQSARIKTNDFPQDQKEFADTLGGVLNPFIDKLVIGFNKNFTVDDNLPFEFKTLEVTVDASGIPVNSFLLLTGLTNFKGYICLNATDLSGSNSYPSTAPFLVFTANGQTITIRKITGLQPNVPYRLVLLGIS